MHPSPISKLLSLGHSFQQVIHDQHRPPWNSGSNMDVRFGDRRAEIYTYDSENIVYGLSWSVSPTSSRRSGLNVDALNGENCVEPYVQSQVCSLERGSL